MAENKKYYWLKLMNDFFPQPRNKKIRKIAGGDTYTIIYLKLQLLSLKNNGVLIFEGIEDNVIEELALTIDEEVDDVAITFQYLLKQGLIEQLDEESYLMTETQYLIGSETASTIRSRKSREKQKALQCNTDATICNTEIDIDIEIEEDIEKKKEKNTIPNKLGDNAPAPKSPNKLIEEEFEKLWKIYPRKQGKAKALDKYKKYRTSKKSDYCTYEEVLKGIEKYNAHIKATGMDAQFIKHGDTFFNGRCWLDEYNDVVREEPQTSVFENYSHADYVESKNTIKVSDEDISSLQAEFEALLKG